MDERLAASGECCNCGVRLGFYATKLVEKAPPHRIACFWERGYKGCADSEGQPPFGSRDDWDVYSDG